MSSLLGSGRMLANNRPSEKIRRRGRKNALARLPELVLPALVGKHPPRATDTLCHCAKASAAAPTLRPNAPGFLTLDRRSEALRQKSGTEAVDGENASGPTVVPGVASTTQTSTQSAKASTPAQVKLLRDMKCPRAKRNKFGSRGLA